MGRPQYDNDAKHAYAGNRLSIGDLTQLIKVTCCTVKEFLHRSCGPKTLSALLALKAFAMGYFKPEFCSVNISPMLQSFIFVFRDFCGCSPTANLEALDHDGIGWQQEKRADTD